jgi:membrane dipeptidase
MLAGGIRLAREVDRVSSSVVVLDAQQERRFQCLMEQIVMVDVHEHPMVLPEEMEQLPDYLRTDNYRWGYQAVKHGGWTAVATANFFRGIANTPDLSLVEFEDVLQEVALMLSDLRKQTDVVKVGNADDIEAAKQQGIIGFLPTLEHLAIGKELNRLDILHGIGVRLAGLTYNRKNYIGDGQFERNDGGLSDFGIAVVKRMNDLGMAIDLSHASFKTAMDAIHLSRTPVAFSHNAAFSIRPVPRCRKDEELTACAQKGGLIAITAVPNSLSDDPNQNIECVLDHYDYMVKLVGVDHVGIGTDTSVGDHVAFHRVVLGRTPDQLPAPYLDGLESPSDGKNIVRGLIRRGYSDTDIGKIAGGNALAFFRRVMR